MASKAMIGRTATIRHSEASTPPTAPDGKRSVQAYDSMPLGINRLGASLLSG